MSNSLNDNDIRELAWVAEVLEHGADDGGNLTVHELNDLAGVIRSKVFISSCTKGTPGCHVWHAFREACCTVGHEGAAR